MPGTGPSSAFPEALSKMTNDVFTHCTTCVVPTARLASLGRLSTTNVPFGPTKPWPAPSKFFPAVVNTEGSTADCSATSRWLGVNRFPAGSGRRSMGFAFFPFATLTGTCSASSRRGAEVPWRVSICVCNGTFSSCELMKLAEANNIVEITKNRRTCLEEGGGTGMPDSCTGALLSVATYSPLGCEFLLPCCLSRFRSLIFA